MSEPTQTCQTCGRHVVVVQTARGFPPDIAKRKLARQCKAAGHVSDPVYRAGVIPDLMAALRASIEAVQSDRRVVPSTDINTG